MSQDLNVDIQALEKFLDALKTYQDVVHDRARSLEQVWQICDESWEGDAKQRFEKEFIETLSSINSSVKSGDEALQWLQDFHEIVEEFEN
jgi:uncharacterized protein YukE